MTKLLTLDELATAAKELGILLADMLEMYKMVTGRGLAPTLKETLKQAQADVKRETIRAKVLRRCTMRYSAPSALMR